MSDEATAISIITEIRELGLDMENCRCQGYDGAGNMAEKYQGATTRIRREYEPSTYVHCASHRLNLCIVRSCEILLVKKMMDHLKAVANILIILANDNSFSRQKFANYYRVESRRTSLSTFVEPDGSNA